MEGPQGRLVEKPPQETLGRETKGDQIRQPMRRLGV